MTGLIPLELGNLSKLEGLYLAHNQLTGCIPAELQELEFHDLYGISLPFCRPQLPGPPTVGTVTTGTPMVRIGSPIPIIARFSEPVRGFTADDVTVANGSAGNFVGFDGGFPYTFDITPNAIGVVTVDIAADVAQDTEGNGNTAADQLLLGLPYDDDHDGAISRDEVLTAIGDYLFGGLLTRDQVVQIIALYLFG